MVTRIDAIFDIERAINGETAEQRLAVRRERSAPPLADLEDWMRTERAGLSRHAAVAKAMDYMLKRWDGFTRFLDDGRICLTNNASERALRPLCLGRKSWLFAGSDRGGERAAVMYTLIGTAKLNDVDPQAWLSDVLERLADLPQTRLHELLPWHWKAERQLRQGKPWRGGCHELKPLVAIQRVQLRPGKGAARQPEASLAWRAATPVVKRRQQVMKRRSKPRNRSDLMTPSLFFVWGQHRKRR